MFYIFIKKITKILFIIFILSIIAFFILNALFPLPMDKLIREKSFMVYDKNGTLLRAYTSEDGMWRIYADIENIKPIMIESLIAYEDKRFYRHPGIDPFSFVRAVWTNIKNMDIVSGFSTITMQIARMIEPKDRTVLSKLIEMFRAVQIELNLNKGEILEVYLNIAPFGGNIEGIASASYIYFGKPHTQLSIGEVALLIGLPNSPTKYRPDVHPQKAEQQRNKVLKRMYEEAVISENKYIESKLESVPQKRYDMPFYAPHISDYLMINRDKNEDKVFSTIDINIQRVCEKLLDEHMRYLKTRGIHNSAVVIIDNETKEVVALVGSDDYFDEEHGGQVNGAMARRSPGSALKPFVYTLALEEGIIGSETMLMDLPEDFSGFEPKNYDNTYRGFVSASKALSLSLNIPAVTLLKRLKYKNLYNTLKEGGISSLKYPEEHYGLSLILGGAEVTLLELTNLYSTLANGGIYKDYKLKRDEELFTHRNIFSEEASYIVSEMLAEDHYLSSNINWKTTLGQHKIAWKTGTSYAHRDAWTIGYDRYYTVGVWVGNFDNKESSDIVGIKVASPIMFDIFKAITKEYNSKWLDRPFNVGVRMVSSISGKLPKYESTPTKRELYIKNITHQDKCNIRQKILVDKKSGMRLYYNCTEGKEYEEKVLDIWPGKMRTWLEQEGYPVDTIPPVHPDCRILVEDEGPKIDSPSDNSVYYLRNDIEPEEQKIILKAHPEKGNKKVYWFIDNVFVGETKVGEDLLYTPVLGKHSLIAMDEESRTTKIRFSVLDVSSANKKN